MRGDPFDADPEMRAKIDRAAAAIVDQVGGVLSKPEPLRLDGEQPVFAILPNGRKKPWSAGLSRSTYKAPPPRTVMTPIEQRVTDALDAGMTPAQAALHLGVKVGSVTLARDRAAKVMRNRQKGD